jgi:dihydroorotate dehydrogenase electron transfer subunit
VTAHDIPTRIGRNVPLGGGCFSLRIEAPEIARTATPGQFVMVGIEAGLRPYLRRAFSIADVQGDTLELVVKTVGVGTAALEAAGAGTPITLLGPLGNGFDLAAAKRSGGTVALVAGGIGVAPFFLTIRRLSASGIPFRIFFGGRTAADLVEADRLLPLAGDGNVLLATDDGSRGFAGRVTALLERELDGGFAPSCCWACGPEPMFVALEKVVRTRSIPSTFSLEREMACGFGVCLGCVVPVEGGRYETLCKDGPCVDSAHVDWERMHP